MIAASNAKFFPHDSEWQRHCARVVSYLNSVPPITSNTSWDGRRSDYPDYLAPEVK